MLASFQGAKVVASESPENRCLSHCRLTQSSPRNPCEYPHKPYIARNYRVIRINLRLYSNFRGELRKTNVLWNRLFGPSRSSKVVDFGTNRKRVHATCCWSSIVTLVVSCPVSEILQVFCWEERPHPYSTRRLIHSLQWVRKRCAVVWLQSMKILKIYISEGSAATRFRYGGILNDGFIANFLRVCEWKNFENRSIFWWSYNKNSVHGALFDSQCRRARLNRNKQQTLIIIT